MKYSIELSQQELQVILGMLSQGPYGQVGPVIQSIQTQITMQEAAAQAQQPEPETPEATD